MKTKSKVVIIIPETNEVISYTYKFSSTRLSRLLCLAVETADMKSSPTEELQDMVEMVTSTCFSIDRGFEVDEVTDLDNLKNISLENVDYIYTVKITTNEYNVRYMPVENQTVLDCYKHGKSIGFEVKEF